MNRARLCCLIVGFIAGGSGNLSAFPGSVSDSSHPGSPTLSERDQRYQLHPSDVVDLAFPYATDFNQTITVQPDGYLGLKSVGEVKAKGLTVPELTEAIRASYSHIMVKPEFTVTLKDFSKPTYTVGGEVKTGGSKELRGKVTVMQAVMGAGGFSDNAKSSQVILFRRMPNDWYEVKQLDAKKMLHTRNLNEDVYVQEGDIIFVPKSLLGKVSRFLPGYSLSTYLAPTSF